MSEFVDRFLKPASRLDRSYIQDTTNFINKISGLQFIPECPKEKFFIVSMDVQSLYPNIDHKESVDTCSHVLDKRTNQSFPTRVIVKLIRLILKCNVTSFNVRFFHQIKGAAMSIPVTVSYANIFMSEFEQRLLQDYEQRYKHEPALWLRFIDNIFLVWNGDEASLKSFLKYCNEYSKSRDMSSNIKFSYSYSPSTVSFLDLRVTIEKDGSLTTSLFSKPSATFQYLSAKSNHPPHTIKAIFRSRSLSASAEFAHSQQITGNMLPNSSNFLLKEDTNQQT